MNSAPRLSEAEQRAEWLKCDQSPLYFIFSYVQIYNATESAWVPFHLWPTQARILKRLKDGDKSQYVILKARQLGLTWAVLGFCLWLMLFRPAAAIGLFSRRETEAADLLDNRLKEMYKRLPKWLQAKGTPNDSKTLWELSNGSSARAFSTSAGDSYTFTFVLVDEADLVPDLAKLMAAVEPTVSAGGWLVLLSRADKDTPESMFKNIYRAGRDNPESSEWEAIFLPWDARPDRTPEWYARQRNESIQNTGSLDYLYEQYPETDNQALAGRTLNKRIPLEWIERNFEPLAACNPAALVYDPDDEYEPELPDAPQIPGFEIFKQPEAGRSYVIGADPAEGNPTSDPSAATVLDESSGEQMARLNYRCQTQVFAGYVDQIGRYYNDAPVLVERNNHGHAVIAWLMDHSGLFVIAGLDNRPGWVSSSLGKALMYEALTEALRDNAVTIHAQQTVDETASIDGRTLKAPEGQHDDDASALALAQKGRELVAAGEFILFTV